MVRSDRSANSNHNIQWNWCPVDEIIPLALQDITQAEIQSVIDVLQGNRLSRGPQLEAFEEACAKIAGRKYGIAVNSGTSALHLCVKSLGIQDGDEVITTPFSFIATTNCILFERAKPVFVDIDLQTYNITPDAIESAITARTRAILPVEAFGNTIYFDRYEQIARNHGISMIEDSCEAFGGVLGNRNAGSFGDASTFGFYPNKQITTGEGGMIVTDRDDIARSSRSYRNQGYSGGYNPQYERLGYNYRLNEVTAALGYQQVLRLEELLSKRRKVAFAYDSCLGELVDNGFLSLPPMMERERASFFVYVIRIAERFDATDRRRLIEFLGQKGIQCSSYFEAIHLQPHVIAATGYRKGQFPVAEHVAEHTIALPFSPLMTAKQVELVVSSLQQWFSQNG